MLTQLQLEGPELEPLLARVRTELGAHARIVHAEKIRSGGVAGFFAHQRFELTVEVDTSLPRTPTPAGAASSGPAQAPATITMPAAPALSAGPPVAAPVVAVPAGHAPVVAAPVAAAPVAPALAASAAPVAAAAATAANAIAATAPAPGPTHAFGGFSAIAGLEPAGDSDEPSLYSGLPTLSVQEPVRPQAPARAAATVYAAQTAPADALEMPVALAAVLAQDDEQAHDMLVDPSRAVPAATAPQAPPARPAVDAAAPATAPTGAAGPAGAAVLPQQVASTAFAPHAAFASLVDGAPRTTPRPDAPPSVLDLAEQVNADEHEARVSTESPSFASLLSRLGSDMGAETAIAPAPGHPAVPAPDQAAATAPAPTGPVTPQPAVDLAATAVPAQRSAPVTAADERTAVSGPEADRRIEDSAVEERRAEESAGAELARLGLPAHLRPTGFGQQLHTALRASLTRLPTAPPAINRPGAVLAVVGPLPLAVQIAREVADELNLPITTSVAVATSGTSVADVPDRQVLRGTAEAVERRGAWRRRSNLTVVAVEAPLTATGAADARAFLTALSPTTTWGAVEATRKAQDVGSWTRALGGVHALAVTDLEETSDPAAVLELGIPISRLGGRPATPRAWATLLTGRLAA